jgi:hypothetical protein
MLPYYPEKGFPVTVSQWRLIRARVQRLGESSDGLSNFAYTLVGLSVPTILSAIGFLFSDFGLPAGLRAAHWIVGLTAALTASVTFLLRRKQKKVDVITKTTILEDMDAIRERFEPDTPPGEQP